MRKLLLASTAAAALTLASISGAEAQYILGQGSLGDVYLINTSTGQATLFADLPDLAGGSEPENAPNSLGYWGGFTPELNKLYRTDWVQSPPNLYTGASGTTSVTNLIGSGFSVAAGDVTPNGTTYYYIDRGGVAPNPAGQLYSLVVNPTIGTPTPVTGAVFAGTLGDLAISPDGQKLYVSWGDTNFSRYDFSSGTVTSITGAGRRYAGLAFDGDKLYGTSLAGNASTLYLLSLAGTIVTPSLIGTITGLRTGEIITDAARVVPIPAALPLMLTALAGLGLVARRRSGDSA